MQPTVNLDPDVAERVEQEARRGLITVQTVVNEALRAHLGLPGKARPLEPFRVEPHDFGFIAGINLDKMNQLADDLEAAAAAQKLGE